MTDQSEYNCSHYQYHLPEESIAQKPLEHREEAKLMLLRLQQRSIEHFQIKDLPGILSGRYHCVFNNSKVIPVKIFGQRATGGKVEFLLTRRLGQVNGVQEI